ncbi:MAG: 3-deoxy-7-phosphoheptulonate synthase [Verrucomicrobiota bacterium]|nr:3-deoxy-7-phosphoheptulonate synthase [Verrucomicrobiota bacterium]
MQASLLCSYFVHQVTNLRITDSVALPKPIDLRQEIPRSDDQKKLVLQSRKEIHSIIHGKDKRLLAVVGPCSIHDLKACREYAERFAKLSKEIGERILPVMRVYFEKPRTTVGWKGLIMDPQLNGTCDIPEGLRIARSFLGEVLEYGIPTSTELLDPITPQYLSDSLCWAAIGARTSESQTHRQMASGLSMPVGFKNATGGDLKAAVNGIIAATQSQTFLGITEDGLASAVTTGGNPDCQLILRGGANGPNYSSSDVEMAQLALDTAKMPSSIMIDCSHANSGKDPARQPQVLEEVLLQIEQGADCIHAVMIESHLNAGNQSFPRPLDRLDYGVSITDGCIDWSTTEACLRRAAEVIDKSRF